MCLLMTYTELMATDNERMYPNIEFTHQIKVCYYLKENKADCIEPSKKYTCGIRTYKYLRIL